MRKRSIVCGALVLACLGITLFGCSGAAVQSVNTAPLNPQHVAQGMRYALPLRLLKFQIWRAVLPAATEGGQPTTVHFAWLDMDQARYVPDPKAQFVLSYRGSGLSSDELTWEVSPNGFLKKVETKFSDQTGEILKAAANLVLEVAKIQAGGLMPAPPRSVVTNRQLLEEFEVDPISSAGRRRLAEVGHGIQIEVTALNDCEPYPWQDCTTAPRCPTVGVAYRTEYPYVVSIRHAGRRAPPKDANDTAVDLEYLERYEQVVMLPNNSPVTVMPITRAAFADKVTNLAFTDGILTHVYVNKPSELLGFFNALLEPVRIVGRIPGEIFTVRLSQAQARAAMIAQETAVLNSMTAYLEALEKYRAAASTLAPEAAPPAAPATGQGGGDAPGFGG